MARYARPLAYPDTCAPPALVLLIDENTSSDGDVLAHAVRGGLGRIVGRRTWGGVRSPAQTALADGTGECVGEEGGLVEGGGGEGSGT